MGPLRLRALLERLRQSTREDWDRKGSLTVSSRTPDHIAADGARVAAGAGGLVDDRTLAHNDDPIGELKDLVEIL